MVRRLRGTKAAGFTDGVLQVARHDAERIVRTAVNHVSAHARQAVFESNQNMIKGVQWVSTLDSRTSQICASLDGQVYGVRSGLRPPAHPNCRSTVVPVLKNFKELGIPGLKNIGTGQRHAREILSGRVPETLTFGQWWKRLPLGKQNEIFGPGKARLLRSGKISFSQLIDQNARPLSLSQLTKLAERVAA
jgi:SPP1 gp7 family putative phage head morphogenesis protein